MGGTGVVGLDVGLGGPVYSTSYGADTHSCCMCNGCLLSANHHLLALVRDGHADNVSDIGSKAHIAMMQVNPAAKGGGVAFWPHDVVQNTSRKYAWPISTSLLHVQHTACPSTIGLRAQRMLTMAVIS